MRDEDRTGWIYTDTTRSTKCPKCGAKPMEFCRTPKGRKAETPHGERTKEFVARERAAGTFDLFYVHRVPR